ncbi:hypothetical protein HID58_084897 [Brassica napus]|uniref:Uncharacterized protein n=1 Tax=Brassica napus TaxID=3708 RepID=A0ABQ7XL40_BRANA|nr:hypothetical protein HID58_084897 [Brassica napus]
MTGDSCSLVSKETRLPLCDMTIVPSKRGLSSLLSDFLLKSGDDSGKTFAREGSGVKFSKSSLVVDADSENLKESQGETNAVDDIGVGDDAVVELIKPMLFTGENLKETLYSRSNRESGDMLATEGTVLLPVDTAYIWSDLNYQDIKGRLSGKSSHYTAKLLIDNGYMNLCLTTVLKKSQKETSSLIQRNSKEEPTGVEFDVMGQWTSLFLNMNDILAREGSRLQDDFVAMKELRENCKIDLERATKPPQHNNS